MDSYSAFFDNTRAGTGDTGLRHKLKNAITEVIDNSEVIRLIAVTEVIIEVIDVTEVIQVTQVITVTEG